MEAQASIYTYNGNSVAYRVLGNGKPMIVLHGWGASSDVMLPLIKSLNVQRTFYLIDFPGFGKSPAPDSAWDVGTYAAMIATFIQEVAGSKVDVIAHSFGGRVTLKLCSHPEWSKLIDKVLITGGAGMKPRRPAKFYFKKYLAKSLKIPFTILPNSIGDKGLNWLRSTKLWKSLGSSDYQQLQGVMREVFVKTVSEYLEGTLPSIQHEVLLLWGENDESTPLYQAKIMERGIKNSGLAVIEQAGHYAFLDRPHQFKVITESFFRT
jgi:pimeloyl-ACP methyl ester carboxylesterase